MRLIRLSIPSKAVGCDNGSFIPRSKEIWILPTSISYIEELPEGDGIVVHLVSGEAVPVINSWTSLTQEIQAASRS